MGVLCNKGVLVAILFVLLIVCLNGQWAEIIEDFLPDNCYIWGVKQGSDGNLYMAMHVYNNPQQTTIAFCIMDLYGQVIDYYAATQDEMNEMGAGYYSIPTPIFTLEPDNTIRFIYIKTVEVAGNNYVSYFSWAFYNQLTGLSFRQYQETIINIDGIRNLIQINSDRWLVVKAQSYEPAMYLIDSEGTNLGHSFVVYGFNGNQYVQKLDESSYIKNTNDGNFQMRTTVVDINGYGSWQQVTDLPVSIHGYEVTVYKYLDNGSALIMYYSGQDSLTYTLLYNNYSLTEFFPPMHLPFYGTRNSCCDEFGLLFSTSYDRYSKYNTQGDLLWQYSLPDSFKCGEYRNQLVHMPEDSCYVSIGMRYRSNNQYTPYLLRLHYGTVSNSDYCEPVSNISIKAFPNPFETSINLDISARETGKAEVQVFNIKGQLVKSYGLFDVKSGSNRLSWDGKGFSGKDAVKGLYFFKVKTNRQVLVKKCLKL